MVSSTPRFLAHQRLHRVTGDRAGYREGYRAARAARAARRTGSEAGTLGWTVCLIGKNDGGLGLYINGDLMGFIGNVHGIWWELLGVSIVMVVALDHPF